LNLDLDTSKFSEISVKKEGFSFEKQKLRSPQDTPFKYQYKRYQKFENMRPLSLLGKNSKSHSLNNKCILFKGKNGGEHDA